MTSTTILIDYLFVRFLVILGTAADVRTPQVQPFYISLFSVVIDLRSLGLVPGVFVGLWSHPPHLSRVATIRVGPSGTISRNRSILIEHAAVLWFCRRSSWFRTCDVYLRLCY